MQALLFYLIRMTGASQALQCLLSEEYILMFLLADSVLGITVII